MQSHASLVHPDHLARSQFLNNVALLLSAYMAIHTCDPATRDQLTYARLLMWEVQWYGNNGWLDYDKAFHQQAAISTSLPWNTIHAGLQAATMRGHWLATELFCTLCREPDHQQENCVLAVLHMSSPQTVMQPSPVSTLYGAQLGEQQWRI